MAYAYVIIGLIVMVTLHELGHFLAARRVGIRATKFYLFFPPAAWKKQRGDVEYGIGWIPLGGFVKLPGMFRPSAEDTYWRIEQDANRIARALGGGAGDESTLLTTLDEVRSSGDPDELARTLERFASRLDSLPASPAPGDGDGEVSHTEYTRSVSRLRQRVHDAREDCHPQAYWRSDLWRRMVVIAAGPTVNLVLAFVVAFAGFLYYTPVREVLSIEAKSIAANSPAEQAGITTSTEIIAWAGTPMSELASRPLADIVEPTLGKPVDLRIRDDKGTRTVHLVPTDIDGERRVGLGNFAPNVRVHHVRSSPAESWHDTWVDMYDVVSGTFGALIRIYQPEVRDQFSSVVGIVTVAENVNAAGNTFRYLALISLALAVLNALPLLPLDGGHLLFGVIEWLRRGRALPRAVFERYAIIGLGIVLTLFVIGLGNDLERLT